MTLVDMILVVDNPLRENVKMLLIVLFFEIFENCEANR